ncbi:hypothetical protein SCAR479_06454 [Seiridium cardinale]|uniref:BRCT domain-containing protein n=1 Tax=Seiridium cardinale TaxID=138064 RepID=A0ABR2XSC2_9PEZI
MPPKKILPDEVYVITSFIWNDDYELGGLQPAEVYTTLAAANAAAKKMLVRHAERCNPLGDMDEWDFHHNETADGLYYGEIDGGPGGHKAAEIKVFKTVLSNAGPGKAASNGKKAIKAEPKEEDEDDDVDEEAPKPTKKGPPKTAINTKTHRKTIPEGIPNCLAGLKLIFTGTFETMDRKTSIATAITYGAEVISKLEDTDYIIIGTRAGPAKLKKINELELETISEEEFFQILENGIPEEKQERMANRRLADQEEGPEEDDDEDTKPKKRGAPKTGPAKKRTRR